MTNQTIEKDAGERNNTASVPPPSAGPPENSPAIVGATHVGYPSHPYPGLKPTKAARAKDVLQTISMAIPIIGACGTLFVWSAANLYVGDVEVVTDKPTPDLIVNVFNQKGQETSYRLNKFQLMPGLYRIEICPDSKTKIVSDLNVQFHTTNKIVVPTSSIGTTSRQAPFVTNSNGQQIGAKVPAVGSNDSQVQDVLDVNAGQVKHVEPEELPSQLTDYALTTPDSKLLIPPVPAIAEPAHPTTAETVHQAATDGAGVHKAKAGAGETELRPDTVDANLPADATAAATHRGWWQRWHKQSE
jgi:hypothetical protein